MKKVNIKLIKQLDFTLILITILIFLFGLFILLSATRCNYSQIIKQILAFGIGVGAIIVFLLIDYNRLGKNYKLFYILTMTILLMVWVPGLGMAQMGARRWIKLGPLFFQTSELAKLTFIICFAKIVEKRKDNLNTLREVVPIIFYALPMLLMMLGQPDLGGTIVFCIIILVMLFTAGINVKLIRNTFIIMIIALPLIYMLMAPHQKVRIQAFLNPDDLSYKGNYQVVQSMIAIGSGGISGKGIFNGTQVQSGLLPVAESDFVFAAVGEELGVIGMFILIILFGLFLFRIIKMSNEAKDTYGKLVIIGVMGMFSYQIIQNIGMTMALIPVTGVTLPFVSAGASSIVSSMACLGLVLSVGMRKRKINF